MNGLMIDELGWGRIRCRMVIEYQVHFVIIGEYT